MRDKGVPLESSHLIGIAKGTIASRAPYLLPECDGQLQLGKLWTQPFVRRHSFTKWHATTGKLKVSDTILDEERFLFTRKVAKHVHNHAVDGSLIINWDQTSVKYVPSGQ